MEDFNSGPKTKGTLAAGLIGAVIGGVIVAAVLLGVLYYNGILTSRSAQTIDGQRVIVDDVNVASEVEAVAQTVPQSVVGISAAVTQQSLLGTSEGTSVGSGFIVTSDGYIVTNQHVISDSNNITISLNDNSTHTGKVVWSDSTLDLAVLKIDATGLAAVTLGDSSKTLVGESVVAIGNPMGLKYQRSVTSGIVSALNRSLMVDSNMIAEDLIQTDASINAGNSGGPLCNAKGEVIGINTYKNYEAEGMGFALPIDIAKPIVTKIISTGNFTPIVIGISGYDSQQASYYSNSQKFSKGIYVDSVTDGSGAASAGIQKGDIITAIGGSEVNSMLEMKSVLYNLSAGDTVNVSYTRGNSEQTVQVTVQNGK